MKIKDYIRRFFGWGQVISLHGQNPLFDWVLCSHKFSTVVWYNICDLLTDLIEDVDPVNEAKFTNTELQYEADKKYAAFKVFMYTFGKQVLQRLFDSGYVVIGYNQNLGMFWQMQENEYARVSEIDATLVKPHNPDVKSYVMKSATYLVYQRSDLDMCKGFLDFMDDVLNGSATVSKRLGTVVVASPKNLNNAPTAVVLGEDQKKELEKQMREDYGSLSRQSNIMLLPREMNFNTINLAGVDQRMQEKVKTAILAVVDRIKIPANQVAIIDAQSSKALANGSEIREGDRLKYKTFRRLFERTFADMARYYRIPMSYTISGEPIAIPANMNV